MSTAAAPEFEVAVIGAGVVGSAVALALARRGAAVALLEAEPEPALAASATNSGILHTGFDSPPGELETEMLLLSGHLRDPILQALGIPVLRCGAVMRCADLAGVLALAAANRVAVHDRGDGSIEIPGEAVTDPVTYTLALVQAARRLGAEVLAGHRVDGLEVASEGLTLRCENGAVLGCRVTVNCAGLHADAVARLAGDESFEIYPRKGEFLVFETPPHDRLERVLLPEHTPRTRGVLVFPTVDGMVVAGPTAVDQEDKGDWSVRPEALEEILPRAAELYPPLEGLVPVASYAGLRPAGRAVNYLIEPSRSCSRLVNVAAIRSTGLSASLGIADRVRRIVESLGVRLGAEEPLAPGPPPVARGPWWRRASEHRALA